MEDQPTSFTLLTGFKTREAYQQAQDSHQPEEGWSYEKRSWVDISLDETEPYWLPKVRPVYPELQNPKRANRVRKVAKFDLLKLVALMASTLAYALMSLICIRLLAG